jgi:hypothetical protein
MTTNESEYVYILLPPVDIESEAGAIYEEQENKE